MRVAVVLEQCWHRVPGGTALAALRQVRAIAAACQIEPVGVAPRHSGPPPEPWRPSIPVRRLGLPRPLLYETWHRMRWPRVERATGPVDIIHATGYAVPPRTCPLVVTLHDLAWRRDPTHFTSRGVRFFEAGLRRTRDDADLVLCPSLATLDDCIAADIEPERLRQVPWGIAADRASDEAVQAVRARYGLAGRYVLFVGTLEPRKNLRTLLEAMRRLPRADVVLAVAGAAGWGPDALHETDPALRDRVMPLGFVQPSDLAPLNRGAAVVCYPSLWEGYGLPVAEALAQGTPVVTSQGTATEELVVGGAGIAVDPRDPDAIASALAEVLDDPNRAASLGEAALARAAERTWETTAKLTVEAYETVLRR